MNQNYAVAREIYQEKGVDTEAALQKLQEIPVSIHCWQIDDLSGFEKPDSKLSGGIAAIGNAPGKPRSPERTSWLCTPSISIQTDAL